MKLNNEYSYNDIQEKFKDTDLYSIKEYGENVIGAHFIVVQDNTYGLLHSFILNGYNSKYGNYYTLIWQD
jgi:hypothetical protein